MPPKKGKKPRPLRPYQKMYNFEEEYKAQCTLYDVQTIQEVFDLYDPLIVGKKKKMPQIIQFADTEINPTQIRPFIEALKKSEVRVRILSFLNTESGDEGLHILAHAFEPPLEIAGLAYHSNGVGPSGCRGLFRALATNNTLAILELDFNPGIGDEGVIGLTNYGHCASLNRLSLKFCNIGDKGAEALGRWIAMDTCQIKELYLNGNKICPPGIIKFAEGLGKNRSLNRVELQDNLFGYDLAAMNAIYDGIQACETLQYINMLNNFECPEGIPEKFVDLVRDKPLGECVLSVKMDTFFFQNMRAISLVNKKRMIKAAKKAAREARKAAKTGRSAAADAGETPAADASAAAPAGGETPNPPATELVNSETMPSNDVKPEGDPAAATADATLN